MKPSVKFGIVAALVVIAMNLVIYYTGNQFTKTGVYSRLFGVVLIIPFIVMSIASRKRELNGVIGYRESLKAGMGTTVIIAIMLAIFNYIFFRLELSGAFLEEAKRVAIEMKLEREKAYEMYKGVFWTYSPGSQATYTLMWTLISGFIITFASATFMVNRKAA